MSAEATKLLIDSLLDILKGVLIFGFTSLITVIFVKKSMVKINFAKKIEKYGVHLSLVQNGMDKNQFRKLFDKSSEITFINCSGYNVFIRKYSYLVEKFLKNGGKINLICSKPYSDFQKDICKSEQRCNDFTKEIDEDAIAYEIFEVYHKYSNNQNFEMRFFNTEYRFAIIKAIEKTNEKVEYFNFISLPPYRSIESIMIKAIEKKSDEKDSEFVEMIKQHIDRVEETSISAKPYMESLSGYQCYLEKLTQK